MRDELKTTISWSIPFLTLILGIFLREIIGWFKGNIKIQLQKNHRSPDKYHGFYAAAEQKDHAEDNNVILLNLNFTNNSKAPFVLRDMKLFVEGHPDNWRELELHENDQYHLHPVRSFNYPLRIENNVVGLIGKNLPAQGITSFQIIGLLPLREMRVSNSETLKVKVSLWERRSKKSEDFAFELKRLECVQDNTGKHLRYTS